MSQRRLERATTDYECWALAASGVPTAVIAARLRTSQERVRQRINRCAGVDGMSTLVLERRLLERSVRPSFLERWERRRHPPLPPLARRRRMALFLPKEFPR